MKIEMVAVKKLLPYARNAKKHNAEQVQAIAASIREFGFCNPVLIDKKNGIVAGHGRVLAATQAGLAEVPCIRLGHLTENQRRAYILADNRLAETGGGWDLDLLRAEVGEIDFDELKAFTLEDLDLGDLLREEDVWSSDAEPQVDRAEELNKTWKVKPGDLWLVGEHRLVCGDSTNAEDVGRVMGVEKADAVVTDSPYGINRDGIKNDDPEGLRSLFDGLLSVFPADNAVVINFQSPRLFPVWIDAIRQAGQKFERALWFYDSTDQTFPWRGWIMTSQIAIVSTVGEGVFAEGNYHHDCYLVTTAGKAGFKRGGYEGNGVAIGGHTTMKPLDIIQELLSHTVGLVYAPFLGSGTTMVAAQNLGRKCYGLEISPAYCAVILQRMAAAFPGIEIRKAKA